MDEFNDLHPAEYDPYWGYSREDYEAWLAERQADFLDQQKEANLVNWGTESLDEVDHDW